MIAVSMILFVLLSMQQPAPASFDFARAAAGDEDALQALVEAGPPAAEAALSEWDAHPLEQRVRAHVVELAGGRPSVGKVLSLLSSDDVVSDARARTALVRFLSRAELGDEMSAARMTELAQRLRADPDADVRLAAVRALIEFEQPEALASLDTALDELPSSERARALAWLATSTRGRTLAWTRLQRAKASDADIIAALLVPCARTLADSPHGAETAADRAPIVSALQHPDPAVRRAARAAVEVLVSRLVYLQQGARASAVLAAFQQEGLDPRLALQQRVRIALLSGVRGVPDPDPARDEALRAAHELEIAARSGPELESRAWSARAAQLEGVTLLAAGDAAAAAGPFARSARLFDALIAERTDLRSKDEAATHSRWLEERATVAIAETVRLLALAVPLGSTAVPETVDALVLESARRAHTLALEAQMRAARADLDAPRTLDGILSNDVGVLELVLDVRRHAAWPAARSIAVRIALGRALAGVAPLELIGFEPYPSSDPAVSDPLRDPARVAMLTKIGVADGDRIAQERSKVRVKILEHMAAPAGADPEESLHFLELEVRFQESLDAQRRVEDGDLHDLMELRVPSSSVSWAARALRDENKPAEARPLLLRARSQLDASDVAQRFYWGTEMLAEIETMLGGSYTDAGDPAQAEMQMSKAVERLQSLEDALAERAEAQAVINVLRNERCNTLVSLAVNANVRMHDTKKAVEWFEKAWAIRQDESMRALLACYRARAGKILEARALLRSIEPGPSTWYNIACTYALLGERELAFQYLRLEIEENQPTPGALERQKSWARTDPDLESLHGDPRFEQILGAK